MTVRSTKTRTAALSVSVRSQPLPWYGNRRIVRSISVRSLLMVGPALNHDQPELLPEIGELGDGVVARAIRSLTWWDFLEGAVPGSSCLTGISWI
jgi:hypothetical protein